jgi:hypothetical protein
MPARARSGCIEFAGAADHKSDVHGWSPEAPRLRKDVACPEPRRLLDSRQVPVSRAFIPPGPAPRTCHATKVVEAYGDDTVTSKAICVKVPTLPLPTFTRVRGLKRLGVQAQEVQLKGDLVLDVGHRRVECDRLAECVQGRRVPAELGQRPAALVMGHRVLRCDPDGPIRRCQGPRVIPRLRTVQRLLAVVLGVAAT